MTKNKYIGGSTTEARIKYAELDKKLQIAVGRLAKDYGIQEEMLWNALFKEGAIDNKINIGNSFHWYQEPSIVDDKQVKLFEGYGLDHIFDEYGDSVNPKRNILMQRDVHENEKGDYVNSGIVNVGYDALELLAAKIKQVNDYVKDEYKPKSKKEEFAITRGVYNRGEAGYRAAKSKGYDLSGYDQYDFYNSFVKGLRRKDKDLDEYVNGKEYKSGSSKEITNYIRDQYLSNEDVNEYTYNSQDSLKGVYNIDPLKYSEYPDIVREGEYLFDDDKGNEFGAGGEVTDWTPAIATVTGFAPIVGGNVKSATDAVNAHMAANPGEAALYAMGALPASSSHVAFGDNNSFEHLFADGGSVDDLRPSEGILKYPDIVRDGEYLFSDGEENKFEEGGEVSDWVPSDSILKYIKDTEAFRKNIYKDGKGKETIGYGFTDKKLLDKYRKKSISKKDADKIFEDELVPEFTKYLVNNTENFDELTDGQRDALFSYIYNIGVGNYKNKNPELHKALSDMDWKEVAQNIDFGYFDEDNSGLKKRRNYERELFGYKSDKDGNVYPIKEEEEDDTPVVSARDIEGKFGDTGYVGAGYDGKKVRVSKNMAKSAGISKNADPDKWYESVNPALNTDFISLAVDFIPTLGRMMDSNRERSGYDTATDFEEKMWKAYTNGDVSSLPKSKYRFDDDDDNAQYVGLPNEQAIIIQSLLDKKYIDGMLDKAYEDADEDKKRKIDLYRAAYNKLNESIFSNPGKWVIVNEEMSPFREAVFGDNYEKLYNTSGLGALKNFSVRWDPDARMLDVKDDYDFNGKNIAERIIPDRDVPLRIRERIKYSPNRGSVMRNKPKTLNEKRFERKFEEGGETGYPYIAQRDNTSVSHPGLFDINNAVTYYAGELPGVAVNANLSAKEYRDAIKRNEARRGRRYVYKGQEEVMQPVMEVFGNPYVQAGLSFFPLIGDSMDAVDFVNSMKEGDKINMIVNASAFLPIVGDITKRARKIRESKNLTGRASMENDYEALYEYLDRNTYNNDLPDFDDIKTEKELDDVFKREIERNRTFVRGIVADDKNDVNEYLFGLAPVRNGYGRYGTGNNTYIKTGYNYVSNSEEQAMGYATRAGYNGENGYLGYMMIGDPIDYSSKDRLDWLDQIDFDYDIVDDRVYDDAVDHLEDHYGTAYDDGVKSDGEINLINRIKRGDDKSKMTKEKVDNIISETENRFKKALNNNIWDRDGRKYLKYLHYVKFRLDKGDEVHGFDNIDDYLQFHKKYKERYDKKKKEFKDRKQKFIDYVIGSRYTNTPKKGIIFGGLGEDEYLGLRHFIITDKSKIHPISVRRVINADPSLYTRQHEGFVSDDLSGRLFEEGGTAGDNVETSMDNYDIAYDYLVNERGVSPQSAIAIMANLENESGMNAGALNSIGAFGIHQWLGPRKSALLKRYGSNPTLRQQLEFLADEYEGKGGVSGWNYLTRGKNLGTDRFNYYMYSKSDFDNAPTIEDATIAWNQGFGRPATWELNNERRIASAKRLASRFGVPYEAGSYVSRQVAPNKKDVVKAFQEEVYPAASSNPGVVVLKKVEEQEPAKMEEHKSSYAKKVEEKSNKIKEQRMRDKAKMDFFNLVWDELNFKRI